MTLSRPILIAGFGSIGRRHLRNLRALGHEKFILYRTRKSTLPDDEISDIPQAFDLSKALSYKPVATIIANPTALHMSVALAAARCGSHLFIEKPISNTLDGVEDLPRLVADRGLIAQVGFQFRFHPGLQKIKRLLDANVIGTVLSVQAHWGEHLPDWHPWEDYRQSYSARRDLGGGVLLTLCHPFDYLRFLLGEVASVSALTSQSGGLGIDVEEAADVLLHFKSGAIGHVHLDYIERPAEHFLHIIGQNGIIHWNNSDGRIKWYSQKRKKWEKIPVPDDFDRNTMFLDEMRHFLSCVQGSKQPICTLDDGIEALRIVLAAKQSVKYKKLIKIR